MLLSVGALGVPAAVEFGETVTPQYFADLLSWASVRAGRSERQSLRSVHHAAAGLALLTLASAWQVARAGKLSLPGLARLDLEPPAALMVVAGTLTVLLAFGEVALAPLGPGMALATTSRKKGKVR